MSSPHRTAYLDLAGGLSGDIFIAAFIDAGVDPQDLTGILRALPLDHWELKEETVRVFGLNARRILFETHPSPPHRHWAEIRDKIIKPADLPEQVKTHTLSAFEALAQAEAKVHGQDPEEVHFHEVGADDSILDLTGAAACLHLAGVRDLLVSPVPLSRGVGRSGHGLLPLPAPATLELLRGRPVLGAGSPTELVTPTGAAILTWAASFGDLPAMRLVAVGAGVGRREPTTGLTRICLGEKEDDLVAAPARTERVAVLTAFIDDMSPELFGALMDGLLKAGALDVAFSPAQMKKNRPGTRLEVLAAPERAKALAALILEDSSSLGLRVRIEDRYCLERRPGRVSVEGLSVGGKWVKRPSGRWDFRPEFDDCRAAAAALALPVGLVFDKALAAAQERTP